MREIFGVISHCGKLSQWFHVRQIGQMPRRKSWFFIFLNLINIVPKYSGPVDISKKETGLIIGEKLWL